MGLLNWLQELGRDANPAGDGCQASLLYLAVSVALPVVIGMSVGFGLRLLDRIVDVEPGRGGH